ncbi:MAG: hypothetical protein AAF390_20000 [Pseudomonadota bacterium]
MKDPYKHTRFWKPKPEECAALKEHLLMELPYGHPLDPFRREFTVEARAKSGDDVIVRTGQEERPFALVRMTFRGRPEMAPFLPETIFYASEAELWTALKESVS